MQYLRQFGIIIVISFLGELCSEFIPLTIPTGIYGMVIMFLALQTGILKLDSVKDAGKFLIEIMPIMFIPAAVGLMESWEVLQGMLIPIITITVVSTVVVMASAGRFTQMIIRISRKRGKSDAK